MMKNDNAHAEQRNKTHVRSLFARCRIDKESDVGSISVTVNYYGDRARKGASGQYVR